LNHFIKSTRANNNSDYFNVMERNRFNVAGDSSSIGSKYMMSEDQIIAETATDITSPKEERNKYKIMNEPMNGGFMTEVVLEE